MLDATTIPFDELIDDWKRLVAAGVLDPNATLSDLIETLDDEAFDARSDEDDAHFALLQKLDEEWKC